MAFNTDMKAHQQQLNLAIAKTDELYASQSSSLVNQAGSVLLKLAPLSVAIYQIN